MSRLLFLSAVTVVLFALPATAGVHAPPPHDDPPHKAEDRHAEDRAVGATHIAVRRPVKRATHRCSRVAEVRERVACRQCTQARPAACILRAALHRRVSHPLQRAIAFCESRMSPYARNPSGASGLMQFMPGTWASTPYARRSVFSAKWNALAGAWLLRRAGTGPWTASRHCWG